jgi:hypothetical protein
LTIHTVGRGAVTPTPRRAASTISANTIPTRASATGSQSGWCWSWAQGRYHFQPH